MITTLDIAGTVVFAITGALAAGRKRMDLFGVLVVAFVTAVGGGTIRDLLLGRAPVFWVTDTRYLIAAVAGAVLAFVYARYGHVPDRTLVVADAFGLAIFTIVGANVALGALAGEPAWSRALIAAIMGTATGCFGGMIRDVLCGEIPLILRQEIYATASLAGGAVFVGMLWLDVPARVAMVSAIVVVLALRLAAIRWALRLPVFRGTDA